MNAPTQIDSGISEALRDATKISMTKNIFEDGRIETAVTAKKVVLREIPLMSGRTIVFLISNFVILGLKKRIYLRIL